MPQQLNDYEKLQKRYNTLNEALYYLKYLFPSSFINENNELILIPETNLYILLNDCNNKFQLFAKLLEWCSRDSCFSLPYSMMKFNELYCDVGLTKETIKYKPWIQRSMVFSYLHQRRRFFMNEKLKSLINGLAVTLTTHQPMEDSLNTIDLIARSFLHEEMTKEDTEYVRQHLGWSYMTPDHIQLSIR